MVATDLPTHRTRTISLDGVVPKITRENNFDLLRLVAAVQVVVIHTYEHFQLKGLNPGYDWFCYVILAFPGVPIFFGLSGFLISRSLDLNLENLPKYAKNRFLRLYPALVACFFVTLLLLFVSHKMSLEDWISFEFFAWVLAQLTVGQFFSPGIFESWGVGHTNGSLWTLPVEMQFYIVLPTLFLMVKGLKDSWRAFFFVLLFIVSCMLWAVSGYQEQTLVWKLLKVSFLPNIWMFCVGVGIYACYNRIRSWIEGRHVWWSILFFVASASWLYTGNLYIEVVHKIIVIPFAISLAFYKPTLSDRVLRGNDFSYGSYIYHMPIVNTLLSLGIVGAAGAGAAMLCTLVLATLSWFTVEKPFLKKK